MDVYIANFGRGNYFWPECLKRSTIATMESEDLRPFWLVGDRAGYIAHAIATKTTAAGIKPTVPVASRWFNIATIVTSTENDVWIHREKNEVWWTRSRPGDVDISIRDAHDRREREFVYEKPADPWSNRTVKGNRLEWAGLHARAREFLFTEGTLQKLAEDNAKYALALINGDDLRPWHSRPDWIRKAEAARRSPAISFNARQRAVIRMAQTVIGTVRGANGQEVLRTVKNKELRFRPEALERYIAALLESQDFCCALSGIPLQFDGEHEDSELLCSMDRIDSDGHYEEGNLQIVCRFVNRWKGAGDDNEFRRLLALVRESGTVAK